MRRTILFSLSLLFFAIAGFSQQNWTSDKLYVNQLFNERLDGAADIHIGPEYVYPGYPKVGSPFFLSDTLTPGWIVYDGHLYTGEQLQWDVQRDFVLVRALNGYSKLILRNDLVDSFFFAGHKIVKLKADPASNLQNTDFYDVLYDGKTRVLVRRKKDTKSRIDEDHVLYEYFDQYKYYIRRNGTYYLVSNKREVLNILSGHRSAVNRRIQKEGLSWNSDFESSVALAAAYYDELNH